MGLIFGGKTRCRLCGQPIAMSGGVVAIPAFIPAGHELAAHSDAAFHEACFNGWSEHQSLQDLYDSYRAIWDGRPTDLKSIDEIDEWGKKAFDELFAPGMKAQSDQQDSCSE